MMLRLGLLVLALRPLSAAAFSHRGQPRAQLPERCDAATPPASLSRRLFLDAAAAAAALVAAPPANAVVIDASQKGGTLKNLTPEEAEERFRAGRESVAYLLRNYDEICEGGGDNVRRYLGTVGTTSGLFGIQKAMKALSERAEDIVEYTELSREIEQTIEQADGSAYMSIFVTTSTSYTPPEKYFKDAKIEIERCAKTMDELAALIRLKL
ncbi:hypothetical protein ACHAXT_008248 [Thalassiosira profunda]